MENNEILKDANGNEVVITSEDFNFVQQDKKIKDKNFDTKPTTFLKDALGRFAKNKSSVVAAIIIGALMLLSLIIPIFTPYGDYDGNINLSKLSPRLFSNGDFWSGKRKFQDQSYDVVNNVIVGDIDEDCVSKLNVTYSKSNAVTDYNAGGIFIFKATSVSNDPITEKNVDNFTAILTTTSAISIKQSDDLVLNLNILNDEDVLNSLEASFSDYQIYLTYRDTNDVKQTLTLADYSSKTGDVSVNISNALRNQNILEVKDAYINIALKPIQGKSAALPINSLNFTTNNKELETATSKFNILADKYALEDGSIGDKELTDDERNSYITSLKDNGANAQVNGSNYSASRSAKYVYGSISAKCSYLFDEYKQTLGTQSHLISKAEMNLYIKNGWCEFNYDGTNYTFKKLSDKCPIESIEKIKNVGSSYEITAQVTMYRYYGYNSMPRFIFGTDNQGRDMLSYTFFALQTSLLIAFIVTIINFVVGIIYGSIEGYFGGNVDLFMERISDILGYLPTIVLLTLLFLNFGKTVLLFGIGMCLTGWLGVASRTRTQFYRFKGREYVLASRTLGASDARLIFKHVLPNSLGTIITMSVLMVPGTISTEATLAYLGLGLQGTKSFGVIMSDNQSELKANPHLVLFPAIIMSLLMISFNLFGNGLRDAFNPSLKGSE